MQMILPSKMDFQTRPDEFSEQSLIHRLYNSGHVRGKTLYPKSPYGLLGRVGGFGAYNPPTPPAMMDCGTPPDAQCVETNQGAEVAYQQALGQAQADNNRDICIADGYGQDVCLARWPVGYSGEVPYNNLNPTQQAAGMQSPSQAEINYYWAQKARADELRTELAKAGQSYIPTSARIENVVTPPTYIAGSSGGGPGGGSGGTPPTTVVAAPEFGLLNRTQQADFSHGGSFMVGDKWQASVSNVAANQPVTVHAIQNGVDLGSSVVGNTGDMGMWFMEGEMTPDTVGHWEEVWTVPAGPYKSLSLAALNVRVSFDVKAASSPTPAVPPSRAAQKTGGTQNTGGQTSSSGAFSFNTDCTDPSQCWGGIPKWMVIAGVGVAALFLVGGKK